MKAVFMPPSSACFLFLDKTQNSETYVPLKNIIKSGLITPLIFNFIEDKYHNINTSYAMSYSIVCNTETIEFINKFG